MSKVPEKAVGQHEISLRDAEGQLFPAAIDLGCRDWTEAAGRRTECRITLRWANGVIEQTDWHFFEAFKKVRSRLESQGLLPLCYGASRRIYLTGMAIDMGLGRKAYRVDEDGNMLPPPVDIFKTGDDVEPVSVEEQERFQDEYRKLLREQRNSVAEQKQLDNPGTIGDQ